MSEQEIVISKEHIRKVVDEIGYASHEYDPGYPHDLMLSTLKHSPQLAAANKRIAELEGAIVGGDFEWHDASEPPDNCRAVLAIVEDDRGVWIRLGTFQHGRWKDTNTFENIGCNKWHELPRSPMQRKRATDVVGSDEQDKASVES